MPNFIDLLEPVYFRNPEINAAYKHIKVENSKAYLADYAELFWDSSYVDASALPLESDLFARAYLALAGELGTNFLIFQLTILFSSLLCGILALVAQLFSRDMVQELEKKSPYECGFFPFDSATRLPFDVHFYVVGIMFLVFDVELVILTTIIILSATMPWSALASVAIFVIILTIGFVYEWACGALRWEAKIPEPLSAPVVSAAVFCLSFCFPSCFAPAFPIVDVLVNPDLLEHFATLFSQFTYVFAGFPVIIRLARTVSWGILEYWRVMFNTRLAAKDDLTVKWTTRWRRAIEKLPSKKLKLAMPRKAARTRAGLVHSWRGRRWCAHTPICWLHDVTKPYVYKKEWAREVYLDRHFLVTKSPTKLQAPLGYARRLRTFLLTRTVPAFHFHLSRLHRWPLVFVISCFIIPTVSVPWYWFVEDYDVVFHDLAVLYRSIKEFSQKELLSVSALPTWARHIAYIPTLYPLAVLRAFFSHEWPYTFWFGFLLTWNFWLYAHISRITEFRSWRTFLRAFFLGNLEIRNNSWDAQFKWFDDNIARPHPDADHTDRYAELTALPALLLCTSIFVSTPWISALLVWNPVPPLMPLWLVTFYYEILYFTNRSAFFDLGGNEDSLLSPQLKRTLSRWYYIAVHDSKALLQLFIRWSPPTFTFILLVLGLQHGFTGILIPFVWQLMYPGRKKFVFPLWNLFVLALTFWAFYSYLHLPRNFVHWWWTDKIIMLGQIALRQKHYILEVIGVYAMYPMLPALLLSFILARTINRFDVSRALFTRTARYVRFAPTNFKHSALWASKGLELAGQEGLAVMAARAAKDRALGRVKRRLLVMPAFLCVIPSPLPILSTLLSLMPLEILPPSWSLTKLILNASVSWPLAPQEPFLGFWPAKTIFHEHLLPDFGCSIFVNFLPEIVLSASIALILLVVAVEITRGTARKLLALACWRTLCRVFLLVGSIYLFQLLLLNIPTLPALGGYLYIAPGLTFSKLFVLLTSLLVLYSSEKYIREHTRPLIEYSIIVAVGVLLLLLLVASNNLMTVFFSIAGFSLALYILILFDVTDLPSREAGLKYFYLSAMSAGLLLMGSFLVYFIVGSTNYFRIDSYLFNGSLPLQLQPICCVAVVFILFGFFFKLSAFPAHLWAAEVYEGSPTPVLAFFVLPVKVAVFLTFLRLLNTAFHEISHFWMPFVFFAAAGSLIWGALAAANAYKVTRFLAYASINQMGFMLLGASADTFDALRATYIYLFLYAVMTGGFMLAYLHIRREDGNALIHISDFGGLARTEASICWSLAVYLFSMAGIPPLAGFFSKYYVLNAVLARGVTALVIIGLIVSLISAYYYLRIIATFWFGEPEAAKSPATAGMSALSRSLMVGVEAVLWVFCVAGAPLLPSFARVVWSLWICG